MKRYKTKTNPTKNLLKIAVLILLALVVIGGIGYAVKNRSDNNTTGAGHSDNDTKPPGYINLDPPTETDKIETDRNKEEEADAPKPDEADDNKKNVTPTITMARRVDDNVEVRAYVSGVYESNGTCTATFTNGSRTVTKSAGAFTDATYTSCRRITALASEFSGSGWTVTVSYSSATAAGTSDSREVDGL